MTMTSKAFNLLSSYTTSFTIQQHLVKKIAPAVSFFIYTHELEHLTDCLAIFLSGGFEN